MRTLALLALFALCGVVVSEGYTVCYFSSWAVYRPGLGKFDVEDVDPFLCTHAIFGFAGLSNVTWTIEVLDPWNENCPDDDPEGGMCAYERFVALKQTNPELKTILAVGGWNEGSEDYSVMVADPEKRSTFIQSCIDLVQKEGFDGLDIDWEYPTQRGGVPADKENFIILLDEFRVEFDKYGLLMTAALASGKPTIDPSYDPAGLVRNLDILSIMTYDYHGAWENFTHHNAPLCSYPTDEGDFIYFNVVASINYWLSLGVPASKMVMGIPLYGRCFTLDDYNEHGMLADASEAGEPGPYTRLPGTLGWNEICERIQDESDCTVVHDPLLNEPYMYCKSDNIWCGYDDEDSVYLKSRFAKNKNLAGTMVWTIDTDDFVPTCSNTKFHLINTIKSAFDEPSDPTAPDCPNAITTATTTTTTTTPTTTTTTTPTTTTTTTTPTTTTTTTTPTTTTTTTTPTTTTTTTTSTTTTTPTTTTTTPTTTTTTPTTTTTTPTTTTTTPTTTTTTTTPTTTTTTPTTTTTTPTTTTTTPTTTTTTPTTTTTTSTTTTTTPTTTTTTPTTTTTTTTLAPPPLTTSGPTWSSRPDCDADPDRVFYPHEDCNKYWWCVNGEATLWLCSPGTYFNPQTSRCDFPDNVDTSNCRVWTCEADGVMYAGAECDEYYECEHGQPIQKYCPDGLFFNPATNLCEFPVNVDTDTCNLPGLLQRLRLH